jgi:quercetin dioxygenase-like cupin family protein
MGELVGDTPERTVVILGETDELHMTWSRYAAGRRGADRHVHHDHTDHFYVLSGELTLMLGPDEVVVPAGHLATMPPGVVHGFRNGSDADVTFLNLHTPGVGFADYMRGRNPGFDQHPPPDDGGRPVTDATITPIQAGDFTEAMKPRTSAAGSE